MAGVAGVAPAMVNFCETRRFPRRRPASTV